MCKRQEEKHGMAVERTGDEGIGDVDETEEHQGSGDERKR